MYFNIGVVNKVVLTAVYSGLQRSTADSEWQDPQAGQDL